MQTPHIASLSCRHILFHANIFKIHLLWQIYNAAKTGVELKVVLELSLLSYNAAPLAKLCRWRSIRRVRSLGTAEMIGKRFLDIS